MNPMLGMTSKASDRRKDIETRLREIDRLLSKFDPAMYEASEWFGVMLGKRQRCIVELTRLVAVSAGLTKEEE